MALVCDSKSSPSSEDQPQPKKDTFTSTQPPSEDNKVSNEEEIDLEDGEIEDDEEEAPEQPQEAQEPPQDLQNGPSPSKSEKSEKSEKKFEQDLQNVVLSPSHSEKSEKHSKKDSGKNRESSKDRVRSKKEEKKERKEHKDHRHMTEAEKSILHLRRKEKMLREKEKYHKKDGDPLDDDFAKNIEKTLATILHKKKKEMAALTSGNEEEREEKRGKKRKKHDKDRHKAKNKRSNNDSPRSEFDEIEMLNVRSGSPGGGPPHLDPLVPLGGPHSLRRSRSPSSDSFDENEFSGSERDEKPLRRRYRDRDNRERGSRDNRDRNWRNNKKDRNDRNNMRNNNRRDRDLRRQHENSPQQKGMQDLLLQDSQGVCVFYMQGKCQKSDCPYSHEASPPMKLELCKFYLMDCCAKGENCSYMHGEFPCKFYHTGLQCNQGNECKFAHGAPLTEGLKQILFKHIETAPRDILGGFPRLSREEALNLINVTQKKLQTEYSNSEAGGGGGGGKEGEGAEALEPFKDIKLPSSKPDKKPRVTRWHQKDDAGGFSNQFAYGTDQDMRITSNGDVDMRTLPALSASNSRSSLMSNTSQDAPSDAMDYQNDVPTVTTITPSKQDVDIRQTPGVLNFAAQDIDIRQPISFSIKPKDVDIRPQLMAKSLEVFKNEEEEENSQSSQGDKKGEEKKSGSQYGPNVGFSQSTMDLIARITANNPTDLNSIPVPQTDYQPATSASATATSEQLQKSDQLPEENTDHINWYSDDDDDDEHRLTIKVEDEENRRDSINKEEEPDIYEGMDQEPSENEENSNDSTPTDEIKPTDIVGKLGDLSKIDISAEVTKLLTSMKQSKFASTVTTSGGQDKSGSDREDSPSTSKESCIVVDPRLAAKQNFRRDSSSSQDSSSSPRGRRSSKDSLLDPRRDPRGEKDPRNKEPKDPRDPRSIAETISKEPRESRDSNADPRDHRGVKETKDKDRKDPRLGLEDPRSRRKGSIDDKDKEKKKEKMSIYEQGGLDMQAALNELENEDFKGCLRPDIDLRMALPFKGMQNYTPATEIDASLNSHLPMVWKVAVVDIPRPDYTGLKLSINDAEKTGDPRLRKLFRLSIDEKDSPMSPKASPKASSGARVDPRRRKVEEKPPETMATEPHQMAYNQQLSILQSSQFYQSLTSNQKLMLNQELADRYEQNTGADPYLHSLLSSLNLLPGALPSAAGLQGLNPMLPNLSKINPAALPMLAAQQAGLPLGQQGLLGAAPGIPNIPVDFPMNFDPRGAAGLLGNPPGPVMFGNQGYLGVPPMEGGYQDEFYGGLVNDNMGNQGGGGNFRGGHHRNNDRDFNSNNRDNNRRRGGRNNFNNNNRNNRHNNNRGGDRGGRRHNNRQNRHHSPE